MFELNESMRGKAKRIKALNDMIRQAEDYTRLKPIVDDIPPKGGWARNTKNIWQSMTVRSANSML